MTPFQKSAITIAMDWLARQPTDLSSGAAVVHGMLEAALAEPEPEPVAWVNANDLQGLTLGHFGYAQIYADESQGRIPLYAAPPEPDATREPATAAEIVKAGGECAVVDDEYLLDFRDGWRAAERHHGIRATEQQPGAAGMSGAEADRVLTDAMRKPCRYPACQDADGRCPRIFAGKCSGPGGVVA
jgi:hypothetical protein